MPEIHLNGPIGRLEARYTHNNKANSPSVLILHAHPGHGGNMNNPLSLQLHKKRAEHWIVVEGCAQVEIDNKKQKLLENQSCFVPIGAKHRLSNSGKDRLIIIEVQSGTYLGEDDIIRFQDKYGREVL